VSINGYSYMPVLAGLQGMAAMPLAHELVYKMPPQPAEVLSTTIVEEVSLQAWAQPEGKPALCRTCSGGHAHLIPISQMDMLIGCSALSALVT